MKLFQRITIIFAALLFSGNSLAGVFKCTDKQGNTAYQSSPCAAEKVASEINIVTGGLTDLSLNKKKQELEIEQKKQNELELKESVELEEERKKEAIKQSALNQELIKNNPIQFSPYAIPPYLEGNLPELIKQYESRLSEIEKFRRLAAQKALTTGKCERVVADELSVKSTSDNLVFSVDCNSGESFFYDEQVLTE